MTINITEPGRYVNKAGEIFRVVGLNETPGIVYSVIGYSERDGSVLCWTRAGQWLEGSTDRDHNLIAPYVEPREIELAVWREKSGRLHFIDPASIYPFDLIARIKVREGDGLTPDELAKLREAQANG